MINLFDNYSQRSFDLHYSLSMAGLKVPTVVVEDDGFLPEDIDSPIKFFTDNYGETGKPLHFNKVLVPDFWEIRSTGREGTIWNQDEKMGTIHFIPNNPNRLVKTVDWYDRKQQLLSTERYNCFGRRFAQTVYKENNVSVSTTYFNTNNEEIVVFNHLTGRVSLKYKGRDFFFKTKVDFVIFYLKEAGLDLNCLMFNSLSTPFLVSYYLPEKGRDILFWQEEVTNKVPDNLQLILRGTKRPVSVYVQKKSTYETLKRLLPEPDHHKLTFLGYLYEFKRQNNGSANALIMTNSDNIERLSELTDRLPNLQFHIAALTEMSPKLMAFASKPNVYLYPNITQNNLSQLFEQCDLYLDINHLNEVLDSLRRAFFNQMFILGFEETVHSREFIGKDFIFKSDNYLDMITLIQQFIDKKLVIEEVIQQQRQGAQIATLKEYQILVNNYM